MLSRRVVKKPLVWGSDLDRYSPWKETDSNLFVGLARRVCTGPRTPIVHTVSMDWTFSARIEENGVSPIFWQIRTMPPHSVTSWSLSMPSCISFPNIRLPFDVLGAHDCCRRRIQSYLASAHGCLFHYCPRRQFVVPVVGESPAHRGLLCLGDIARILKISRPETKGRGRPERDDVL
ncbi:hypothetical protein B0H16DRAFT_104794 [Mycena metata]|uniref:Uncharacterized protein n=1 Tax=Mycena metata TaxID=1033252 RepID=A0AAD7I9Z2_9AGAR|nr:hypothetical protein B0H16DRAFT_104794 [Mycena metata]